jgi:hypothetical protein
MMLRDGMARRLVVGVLAACLLLTLPPGWPAFGATAASTCSRTAELRASTCRLTPGEPLADTLADTGGSALYRLDNLTPTSTLNLKLAGGTDGTAVAVVNWRGEELGSATRAAGASDARLVVDLRQPGAYGVRVSSTDAASTEPFELTAGLEPAGPVPTVVWPTTVQNPSSTFSPEKRTVLTARGAVPGGPGLGRESVLGKPPDTAVGDFTLVADVHFEQIVGPSAITVRFRFEPEAGGGSGYFLALDPVAGEASLDSFEEGRRRTLIPHAPLPVELQAGSPRRLVLRAVGSEFTATLDGQPVLTATDSRYPRGLIAVGTFTWSEPTAVIFDHLLITKPS